MAALLGLSPWRTPLDVYLDKVGQAEPIVETEPMQWGNILEDVVAHHWQEKTGRKVQRVNSQLRHPEHPYAIANIDRAIVVPGSRVRVADDGATLLGADGIFEAKTASAYADADWRGLDGSDSLPVYYAAQGMFYLGVTGQASCEFAALIGGQRFVMRRIERDEDTIAALLDRARHFWQTYVETKTPPAPVSGSEVRKLWPRDSGDLIAIDERADLLGSLNELRALRRQAKDLEEPIERATDALQLAIGQGSGLSLNGSAVVTWKAAKDSTATDWKAAAAELAALYDEARAANAPPAKTVLDKFTTTKPGSRRFLLKD